MCDENAFLIGYREFDDVGIFFFRLGILVNRHFDRQMLGKLDDMSVNGIQFDDRIGVFFRNDYLVSQLQLDLIDEAEDLYQASKANTNGIYAPSKIKCNIFLKSSSGIVRYFLASSIIPTATIM